VSESADQELPAISGIYVELDRYRRLIGLEQQARALLDALHQAQRGEDIPEVLRLALAEGDAAEAASMALNPPQWALYRAFVTLIDASGWKPR
jgi:hypothetical protein